MKPFARRGSPGRGCDLSRAAYVMALIGVLSWMATGCRSVAPRQGTSGHIHPRADIVVNSEQARLRVRALVEPYCAAIVKAADRISRDTSNPAIRREALLWKIEAVPAMRETLFQSNPFLALTDAWVLLWQMTDHFEKGSGARALGDLAPMAVATCQHLDEDLRRVGAGFTRSGEVGLISDFVRQWAAEHPIQHSIAGRESVLSHFTALEVQERFSMPEVAGNLVVTLDDLSRRLDIFSAQIPEQSRWQAELFAMDLAADYQLDQTLQLTTNAVRSTQTVLESIDRIMAPLEQTLAVAGAAPETIARERAVAIEALSAEVSRAIQVGQQERLTVLEAVTKERVAALIELHENLIEERKALTQDVDTLVLKAVDRAMFRIAVLSGVIAIGLCAWTVVLLFLGRRLFRGEGRSSLLAESAPPTMPA
ncbi:MAG: hypothetical protein H7A46_26625 [Verrucomicrobiales bacterium]|nr:hypothetical protein [Verrucomicrobiales bacterium]